MRIPLYIDFADIAIIDCQASISKNFWSISTPCNFTNNLLLKGDDFEFSWPINANACTGYVFQDGPAQGLAINFHVARTGNQYGHTKTGSIIYNNTFNTDFYTQLRMSSQKFKYEMMVAEVDHTKFLYTHQIDFTVWDWLKLGVLEGTLLHEPFELRYLNPLMIMHSFASWTEYADDFEKKYYGEGHVCAYMGIKFDLVPCRNLRIYGLFSQTEVQPPTELGSPEANSLPDGLGFQLGADAFRRLYSIMTGRNCRRISSGHSRIQIGRSCGCVPVQSTTEKSRREKRLILRYKEWFYHSEVLFELIHSESLYDLLYMLASRIYLVCHWSDFRVFLTDRCLKSLSPQSQLSAHKDCCQVLWTDRAGRSSGISERPMKQGDIISCLTESPDHPSAYFLSPLHMNERQFGFAALSFGRLACCYQPEYCTLIGYLCLALDQLEERSVLRAQTGVSAKDVENPQLYQQLGQLREEMQQHPEADWSVQELCGHTHVSRSYLQRMYKKYFGKSIVEELIDFRLQKAKELISSTDLTMSHIAELCGYASYAHFAKQFKVNEGMTLSEYRQRFRRSKGV